MNENQMTLFENTTPAQADALALHYEIMTAARAAADSLLNLSFSEAEDTFYAVQTQAAEPVKRSYTLAVCLPLAALAIGAGELVLRKKKRKQ